LKNFNKVIRITKEMMKKRTESKTEDMIFFMIYGLYRSKFQEENGK